jgi:L-malate glycosyltransferase
LVQKYRQKTNVLFVVIGLGLGGSERIVLDLAQHIDKSRFNIYLAYLSAGALIAPFSHACVSLFPLQKGRGLDFRPVLELRHIIKKYKIDVINAHHYLPFLLSFLANNMLLNNRLLFYTEHSVAEVDGLSPRHAFSCRVAFFRTNGIIGVSEEITLLFRKKYPIHSARMICIPNAVDVSRFSIAAHRNNIRSDLGILSSHFVIGTVANFRKVKNHACLIKAFHRIAEAYPETRLLFVGRGFANAPEDSEKEIKRLIKLLGLTARVIFAGYRNDVSSLLKAMDIFCLPSLAEGLPVSVLEAMASGVPVVGSDVSGIKEIVSSGETGLLFPSNDGGLLAKALEKLINDPDLRSTLAKKAFDFVRQEHGIDQWVDRYERLFGSTET